MRTETTYHWTEPSTRHYLSLRSGDVATALQYFKTQGIVIKCLLFNPMYVEMATDVPEGIDVDFSEGVAGWEIAGIGNKI
jgi:hypothetical protein